MKNWTKQTLCRVSVFICAITAFALLSCNAGNRTEGNTTDTTLIKENKIAGFKFMVLLKKQKSISFEEYKRYFFETHLPYVRAIPGLRGYKVNLRHPDDENAPYDSISEFLFDDRAAYDHAMASAETKATLADAAKFLMPPQIFLVDERVILSPEN